MDGSALTEAARLIANASSVVAFTGAGISVESGIPDFRSPGGLWSRFDPSIYCSYNVFLERPELFWEMALEMHESMGNAKPNAAHYALAELERLGRLSCVITQNVDNLHQMAGSKVIYELHGNSATTTCMSCKARSESMDVVQKLKSEPMDKVPRCSICKGVLKMDAVLFGEALPKGVMDGAMQAVMGADVLLVVGTSLMVSPANYLVDVCRIHKGKVIICDPNLSISGAADLMLHGKAGDILPQLVQIYKHSWLNRA